MAARKPTEQIRVIEWDEQSAGGKPGFSNPAIYTDTYQVLEWILRQALLTAGYRVGFDRLAEKVRANNFKSAKSYVEAIYKEIHRYEVERRGRFKAAEEYVELLVDYGDEIPPEAHEKLQTLEHRMGLDGPGGTDFIAASTLKPPQRIFRYGLERMYCHSMLRSDVEALNKALAKRNGSNPISAEQWLLARTYLKRPGLILRKSKQLELDHSKGALIKESIFLTAAVFGPFFKTQSSNYPLNRFISQKLDFLFRSDEITNPNRSFRKLLSPIQIRERIKGNPTLLKQREKRVRLKHLVSDDLYEHLSLNNGRINPMDSHFL
jgi:hypothetical protein